MSTPIMQTLAIRTPGLWSAISRASTACGLVAALTGCVGPIDLVIAANAEAAAARETPASANAAPEDYRAYGCASLAQVLPTMQDGWRTSTGFGRKVYGWHVDSIQQVMREKRCDGAQAAAQPAAGAVRADIARPSVDASKLSGLPAPSAVASSAPPPVGPARYCVAMIAAVDAKQPQTVLTNAWEDTRSDGSEAAMLRTVGEFAAHVRQLQPGVWHEMPKGKCFARSKHCTASATRTFGTSHQINQFCFTSLAEAQKAQPRLLLYEPLVIDWKPAQ